MVHRKMFRPALLIIAAGLFTPVISNAQLTVLANGNVGIGTAVPVQKLDVILNAADPAQQSGRFTNNSNTAAVKYGIRNTVSNAGTGGRYGIFNDVQQLSTSGSTSYGFSNTLTAGTGGGYGIYNVNNSGGNGFRYGMYNYVNQANPSGNLALGIYNYTNNTLGYSYGIYNINYITGASVNTSYGQYNYQYSAGSASQYGIFNYVTASTATTPGNRYALWTEANNTGSGIRYGIYSRALGAANYAGYFDGNVFVNGNFTVISDDELKTNLAPIDNALEIMNQLNPKKFDFRTDVTGMTFPEGPQLGIMASEIDAVLPELVKKVSTPLNLNERGRNTEGLDRVNSPEASATAPETMFSFRTVNYIGLIPVLVQAVKDQQQMIGTMREQLRAQQEIIERLQRTTR
jgi:hypothetical protein